MDDLITWLKAQLDDDERIARATIGNRSPHINTGTPGKWNPYLEGGDDGWAFEDDALANEGAIVGDEATTYHITRWDPARVLREVQAKRRIIGLVTDAGPQFGDGYTGAYRDVLRLLALPYADRPGYQDRWRP